MFNKILASIGIGSAKVDTRLADPRVRAGEELMGVVHIQGGSVEQSISQIYMYLYTDYYKEVDDKKILHKEVLASYKAADSLSVKPGEVKEIPFSLTIPYFTPISIGRQKVYLSTGLDIDMAIDPKDLDPVIILPDPLIAQIFAEMEQMGFRHSHDSGICEYKKFSRRQVPFVQEFEFKPTRKFRHDLDEIEFIFDASPDRVQVLMQVDKKARGLAGFLEEALDLDEKYVRFTIDRKSGLAPGELESLIRQAIHHK